MSMSNKSIGAIIKKLNSKNFENIFLQRLSENVEYGIVWHKVRQYSPHKGRYYSEKRDRFYFFKDESDRYVGAVLIMDTLDDLHAFVKKEYRRHGYLTSAMQKVILPHLLKNKEKQRITIDIDWLGEKNFRASKKSALKNGFKQETEKEYYFYKKDITFKPSFEAETSNITEERIHQLCDRMEKIAIEIRKIEDEFEISLGKTDMLKELRVFTEDMGNRVMMDDFFEMKRKTDNS